MWTFSSLNQTWLSSVFHRSYTDKDTRVTGESQQRVWAGGATNRCQSEMYNGWGRSIRIISKYLLLWFIEKYIAFHNANEDNTQTIKHFIVVRGLINNKDFIYIYIYLFISLLCVLTSILANSMRIYMPLSLINWPNKEKAKKAAKQITEHRLHPPDWAAGDEGPQQQMSKTKYSKAQAHRGPGILSPGRAAPRSRLWQAAFLLLAKLLPLIPSHTFDMLICLEDGKVSTVSV